MKPLIYCLFILLLNATNLEAHMIHQKTPIKRDWKEENLTPFNELMISWNAPRPVQGKFLFYISVKTDEWSPWLLYASWGSEGQSSFSSIAEKSPIKVYQDALEVLEGGKATAFQVKIIAEEGALLDTIYGLHVYTNGDKEQGVSKLSSDLASVSLEVSGLSQMAINHVRHKDLCSPTSTTAITRYLSNDNTIDPSVFAQKVWDSGFNIYGNWVFNVAQAATYLGSEWDCWVERLNGFEMIHQRLVQGSPVVVSVKGPLTGSALPYAKGHLVAVIGYDSVNQKVLCMDPAFPTDQETLVSYDLEEFTQARSRRGNVAYIFSKNGKHEDQ